MDKCNLFKILGSFVVSSALLLGCSQTVKAPSQESSVCEGCVEKGSRSSENAESSSGKQSRMRAIYEAVVENGEYTTRDSVAAYLCKYDELPGNYVDKDEGERLYEAAGYVFSKWNFNPWTTIGVMIGGDDFDNYASDPEYYHASLPEGSYREADVDYNAPNRGTRRLVYKSGCNVYYTADHYENFTRLEF